MVWRVGVVPYLNAAPLAAALREPDGALLVGEAVEARSLVPSRLIEALLAGEVDVALASTAAVLPEPELRILPGMAVASEGPVRSISLYCRRPVEEVRRVALDASSRSAVALARVLFAERWRRRVEFLTLPPHLSSMLEQADAGLLIGNPALEANHALESGAWRGPSILRHDLGTEWTALTRLPFVWAIWAARAPEPGGRDLSRLSRLLTRAKGWGLRRLGPLAARGAAELALPESVTRAYLTHSIRYDLGPREQEGLQRFCNLAIRHGVLPAGAALRFADEPVDGDAP